jgi:hypothetical protein
MKSGDRFMKSGGLNAALQCPQSGKSGSSVLFMILIGLRNPPGDADVPVLFTPICNETKEIN